jgi:hypothetical protein
MCGSITGNWCLWESPVERKDEGVNPKEIEHPIGNRRGAGKKEIRCEREVGCGSVGEEEKEEEGREEKEEEEQ